MPEQPSSEVDVAEVGSSVEEFVASVLAEIGTGLQKEAFTFCSREEAHVTLEFSAAEVREAEGGLRLHVFNAGGRMKGDNSQRLTVYARKPNDADRWEEQARTSKAQAEAHMAERLKRR